MVFSQAYTLLMSKHSGCGIRPMFYVSQQEAATLSLFNESLKSLSKESKQRPRKKTYSPQTEDGKKYYYFNKNISSFSLSSRSLSPFLSSHFFIFSSLVTLSLSLFSLLHFLFSLSHSHFFLFSAVCLHCHHLEGDGNRGSWIVVDWVSSTLSQKNSDFSL